MTNAELQKKVVNSLKSRNIDVVDHGLEPQWGLKERKDTTGHTFHNSGVSDRPLTSHNDYHVNENGWNMVGYHFYIRPDGTVELGRPVWAIGAHAGTKANRTTIGTCFSGNMNEGYPTDEQYHSAVILHEVLEQVYSLIIEEAPGSDSHVEDELVLDIYGHNNFMNTACPGDNTDLNIIKEGVSEKEEGDSLTMEINGREVPYPLEIRDGRTFVKIANKWLQVRDFVEMIPQSELGWESETQTVFVEIPE